MPDLNDNLLISLIICGLLSVVVLVQLIILLRLKRHKTQLQQQQSQTLNQLHQSQHQLNELNTGHSRLEFRVTTLTEQLDKAEHSLKQQADELNQKNQALSDTTARLAASQAQSNEAAKQHEQQIKLLDDARKQLKIEFENTANKIFEEKSQSFSVNNKQGLAQTLNPLREQLADFKRKVEDVYEKESKERQSLLHEIGHLKNLNQQISQDAINLTNALKADTKSQGNWGEVVLERVLQESGLRKGHEYQTQISLKQDTGKRYQPDVIVHLPDKKDVIIDAKVSLLDYERYCSSTDENDKKAYLKAHLNSIRQHVKGIAPKAYENLQGVNSLDFILIFIPIEPAFLLAFEHDGALFSEAYDKGIIIVSPTTLLAVLRTVQSLWRYDRQNQNAEEIARIAGSLHDTISRVAESAIDIGHYLDKAQAAQSTTLKRLSEGKGNLATTAQRLSRLGAKVKKTLPNSIQTTQTDEE